MMMMMMIALMMTFFAQTCKKNQMRSWATILFFLFVSYEVSSVTQWRQIVDVSVCLSVCLSVFRIACLVVCQDCINHNTPKDSITEEENENDNTNNETCKIGDILR